VPDLWPGLAASMDAAVLDHLGITVAYKSGVLAPVQIVAVFDAQFVREGIGEPGISTQRPMIFTTLSRLPAEPKQGDLVTVASVDYRVTDIRKDGQGGIQLHLHRKAA
jgi:hypothetical protein